MVVAQYRDEVNDREEFKGMMADVVGLDVPANHVVVWKPMTRRVHGLN